MPLNTARLPRALGPLCLSVAVWIAAAGCSDGITGPANLSARYPADLSLEWRPTSPAQENVDSAALSWALKDGATVQGLTSLLVVRHSRLVGERYYTTGGADSLYSARSVTKSVMALLVGIAIHQARIAGTDVPLSTYFRPPLPALDSAKGAITIRDLLTMTSGFAWNEEGNPGEYDDWISAPDQVLYLVRRPLACPPGQCWNYNSAAAHLTSVIISQAVPAGTAAFADSVLFTPLGFRPVQWEILSGGYPNGGAGLYLRPRDMAKIGALMLQQGVSGHSRVVSPSWVAEITQSQLATPDALPDVGPLTYGELWWTGSVNGHRLVLAWGFGGQFIWIVPDLDLVIVTTARWQALGDAAYTQASAIAGYIASAVMPTVQGELATRREPAQALTRARFTSGTGN